MEKNTFRVSLTLTYIVDAVDEVYPQVEVDWTEPLED